MYWDILKDFLICVPATVFFTLLMRVPRRAVLPAALLGGLGYAAYEVAKVLLQSSIAGYFLGTLLMAACSEILARFMHMPATVFIIPAIIPLVPGLGLYQTMNDVVQGQNSLAAQVGTTTLLSIAAMAMAMVLTTLLAGSLRVRARKKKRT